MTETSEQTPSKRKVIVVDDDQVIANALAIVLNQAGFDTRAVFSGEQAIELLESFQPEMLIADVVMSGMTGIEAAIAIRNKLPSAIFFSSQDRPLPPSCWNRRGRRAMNLKSSPNLYIQPIYLRSCVCLAFSILELQPSRAATLRFSWRLPLQHSSQLGIQCHIRLSPRQNLCGAGMGMNAARFSQSIRLSLLLVRRLGKADLDEK